jgi:hypothetical protein
MLSARIATCGFTRYAPGTLLGGEQLMANAQTELMAAPDTETAPTRWFQSDGGKVLIIGTGSVVIVLILLAIGALAGFKIPPPAPDQPAAPTSTSAPAATSPAPATVAPAPITTPAPTGPVSPKPAPSAGPSTMTTHAPPTYTPPPAKQYTPPAGQAGTAAPTATGSPTAPATATASSADPAPANPPQMTVIRTTNGVARPIPGNS